jgi:LssY C-terminus
MMPRWQPIVAMAAATAALSGCVSSAPPTDVKGSYLERAVARVKEAVVVTASVLDQEGSEYRFGGRLDLVGIQPVWIKIQNLGPYTYILFLRSIDRDYFSPYEAARRASVLFDTDVETLYEKFRDAEIKHLIPPGQTVEGVIYTHLDEGLKAFRLDILGNRKTLSFDLALEVPGLTTDYADFQSTALYNEELKDLSLEKLRYWLKALSCCTSSKDGVPGDPINIALVGTVDDVRAALVGQGWDVTAELTSSSLEKMIEAFVFNSRYRYAPVSDLFLFQRAQDMAFQKARAAIDERNHIRLWLAPVTHEGAPVWVGHISRDAGIKFSGRFWPPTTHVIDPAVDEARFYLEQDLIYSNRVSSFGVIDGVGAATVDSPRRNAEQDPYFTDGLRAVFFIDDDFVPLERLEVLNWSLPPELEPFRESIFLPPPDHE